MEYKRIESLDVLRGVAILGILIINIHYFSTLTIERYKPIIHGDFSGANKWLWIISYTFVKQRFMTLFSILFGAGVFLMYTVNKKKGREATKLHYVRMFWLLVFGCIHAYLIWWGDILVNYALCGLVVYGVRNLSPKIIFWIGGSILIGLLLPDIYKFYIQKATVDIPEEFWNPSKESITNQLKEFSGSWWEETPKRINKALYYQTTSFYTYSFWRVSGLMMIGMGLVKTGFITGKLSKKRYYNDLIISSAIGLPMSMLSVYLYLDSNFDYAMFSTSVYILFYISSMVMAYTYICILILCIQSSLFKKARKGLSNLGRMAFTNYILQNVICSLLFYGYGLGYYGKVDRVFLLYTVLVIWGVQLLYTTIWLHFFRYGPLEWLWKSLTYGKKLPFKKGKE
ncbi:DUF418 domain-containing protein [Aquimarina hainanensis]|uniref:DUF418 domain-containing protein n=1 Tax=Aquimarina hainanensis TaxID=1578017 RepID=A0ABW5N5J5_9FLAO